MSDDKKVAVPVPAATIVLMRDGDAGLEMFMVVRHHQIDFASGALVFPGGKVDAQDTDPRVVARIAPYDGADPGQSRLRAAAIREPPPEWLRQSGRDVLGRERHTDHDWSRPEPVLQPQRQQAEGCPVGERQQPHVDRQRKRQRVGERLAERECVRRCPARAGCRGP